MMQAYQDFLNERASEVSVRKIHVALRYEGDIGEIEALGFDTVWKGEPGEATGSVDLVQLEEITTHPGVLNLSAGEEFEPMLDDSIPDVKANKVWNLQSGTFGGYTGAGVVIGIIDTGIDFTHYHFRERAAPRKTRILSIWDQGLIKKTGEKAPTTAQLAPGSPGAYGVVYDSTDIDNALNKTGKVRHRDCEGHGTHVASIAAGNGESKNKYVGVAPRADIVVVKIIDLENTPEVNGTWVTPIQRFKDAVSYIRAVAGDAGAKPTVINFSLTTNFSPHDGFTDSEDWLTDEFSTTIGEVVVVAAGNTAGRRQHAQIDTAGPDHVDIHFELYDNRGANRHTYEGCKRKPGTKPLHLNLMFAKDAPFDKMEIELPKNGGIITSPTLGVVSNGSLRRRKWWMSYSVKDITLRSGRGKVERRQVLFRIDPYRNRHVLGTYKVRVTATDIFEGHLWCTQSKDHGFRIATSSPTQADDKHLIGEMGGAANVITVAAHDAETSGEPVWVHSSRGPLVHYNGPAQPAKPDISAPGYKIDAAKSSFAKPLSPTAKTTPKNGTSFSASHVAGAAALLLDKNQFLTTQEIIDTLKNHSRKVSGQKANEVGEGRLDCHEAVTKSP